MKFDDLVKYKTLSRAYAASGGGGAFLDNALENLSPEEKKTKVKNVCALISIELFDQLENVCGFLELSKREFIEAALVECLNRAEAEIKQSFEPYIPEDAYKEDR